MIWLRLYQGMDARYHQVCLSANVANAYWNRDNSQANLDRNDADNRDENNGASSAVRDYAGSDRFQPPSCRLISRSWAWIWKTVVGF